MACIDVRKICCLNGLLCVEKADVIIIDQASVRLFELYNHRLAITFLAYYNVIAELKYVQTFIHNH